MIQDVEGATSIGPVTAENIAVDGSTLTATNNYSVDLSGSAEQNAKALDIVNAAGSMVSNGVNIARTTNISSSPVLNQVNTISQHH